MSEELKPCAFFNGVPVVKAGTYPHQRRLHGTFLSSFTASVRRCGPVKTPACLYLPASMSARSPLHATAKACEESGWRCLSEHSWVLWVLESTGSTSTTMRVFVIQTWLWPWPHNDNAGTHHSQRHSGVLCCLGVEVLLFGLTFQKLSLGCAYRCATVLALFARSQPEALVELFQPC